MINERIYRLQNRSRSPTPGVTVACPRETRQRAEAPDTGRKSAAGRHCDCSQGPEAEVEPLRAARQRDTSGDAPATFPPCHLLTVQ